MNWVFKPRRVFYVPNDAIPAPTPAEVRAATAFRLMVDPAGRLIWLDRTYCVPIPNPMPTFTFLPWATQLEERLTSWRKLLAGVLDDAADALDAAAERVDPDQRYYD